MNASRSLIPGGWPAFWGQPLAVRGQTGSQHWLPLAAAMLLLAAWPVAGAEAFSGDAPVFHTKDAPSDARVLQRIQNSAGLRGIFSVTRDYDHGSVASGNHREVVLISAPHHFLPQLPPEQRSLAVFTAGLIVRHFEKLSAWSGQSGAGVLYPINARVGLFVDARTVMPNGSRHYGVARAGLRILF